MLEALRCSPRRRSQVRSRVAVRRRRSRGACCCRRRARPSPSSSRVRDHLGADQPARAGDDRAVFMPRGRSARTAGTGRARAGGRRRPARPRSAPRAVLRRVVRLVPVVPLAREDEPVRPAQLVGQARALAVRRVRGSSPCSTRPAGAREAGSTCRSDRSSCGGGLAGPTKSASPGLRGVAALDHHSRRGAVVVVEAAVPPRTSRSWPRSGRPCSDRSRAAPQTTPPRPQPPRRRSAGRGANRAHHEQHERG